MTAQNAGRGVSVPLTQTLTDCEVFLRGDYDHLPEERCYMRGAMEVTSCVPHGSPNGSQPGHGAAQQRTVVTPSRAEGAGGKVL